MQPILPSRLINGYELSYQATLASAKHLSQTRTKRYLLNDEYSSTIVIGIEYEIKTYQFRSIAFEESNC